MPMPILLQHGDPPACPFCGAALPRPRKRLLNTTSVLPGGRCACGACFVVDPTGRNGGHALLEALEDACGGDRERSLFLQPERDYRELIENYDTHLHRYVKGFRGYRRGMARLYLVKLNPPSDAPQHATPPAA